MEPSPPRQPRTQPRRPSPLKAVSGLSVSHGTLSLLPPSASQRARTTPAVTATTVARSPLSPLSPLSSPIAAPATTTSTASGGSELHWTVADLNRAQCELFTQAREAGFNPSSGPHVYWSFVRTQCMDRETIINTERNRFIGGSVTSSELRYRGRSASGVAASRPSLQSSSSTPDSAEESSGTIPLPDFDVTITGDVSEETQPAARSFPSPSRRGTNPTHQRTMSLTDADDISLGRIDDAVLPVLSSPEPHPTEGTRPTTPTCTTAITDINLEVVGRPIVHRKSAPSLLENIFLMRTGTTDSGLGVDSRPVSAASSSLCSQNTNSPLPMPLPSRGRSVTFDPLVVGRELRTALTQVMNPTLTPEQRSMLQATVSELQRELDTATIESRYRSNNSSRASSYRGGGGGGGVGASGVDSDTDTDSVVRHGDDEDEDEGGEEGQEDEGEEDEGDAEEGEDNDDEEGEADHHYDEEDQHLFAEKDDAESEVEDEDDGGFISADEL